jgi:hypothetical protein
VLRVPATLRLLALALAGLWVLLPVASALHDGDHAHRYCAEHGAVEEVGEALASDGEGSADESAGGLDVAGDGQGSEEHVDCAFAFVHGLGDGAELVTAGPVVGDAEVASSGLSSGRRGVRGLPVLAVAPKGSPPQRG